MNAAQALADIQRQEAAIEELARRARLELERRRHTPEFLPFVKKMIISRLHAKQRDVLRDLDNGLRFLALCCSRRAGKTHLIASLIVLRLIFAKFGQEVVFAAPTLDRGKELIWDEVVRMIDEYGLGWKCIEQTGKIRTPWGAKFRIIGLDNKRMIGKQRGGNCVAFFADECQEFAYLLDMLLVAVRPGLGQSRGWFIASGTPGLAKRGIWFRMVHKGEGGFVGRHWTLRDNPHLGRPGAEIVAEEKALQKWPDDHPTLLREWLGIWVDDAGLLVCEFSETVNIADMLECGTKIKLGSGEIIDYDKKTWKHFIGVDYGFSPDPCAWVVAAAHPHRNLVVILHVEKHFKFTSDEIADKTNVIHVDFKAKRIVGDSASGGSTFIADFNKRYGKKAGIRMRHADKVDRDGSITMLNTELRTARLVALRGVADLLIEEMLELQWKDPEHTDILPGADHAFDGCRYVLRALNAYLANPKEEEPDADELERQRIAERNRRAREQQNGGRRGRAA